MRIACHLRADRVKVLAKFNRIPASDAAAFEAAIQKQN